jgi:hypothetical protein
MAAKANQIEAANQNCSVVWCVWKKYPRSILTSSGHTINIMHIFWYTNKVYSVGIFYSYNTLSIIHAQVI